MRQILLIDICLYPGSHTDHRRTQHQHAVHEEAPVGKGRKGAGTRGHSAAGTLQGAHKDHHHGQRDGILMPQADGKGARYHRVLHRPLRLVAEGSSRERQRTGKAVRAQGIGHKAAERGGH